MKFPIKLKVPAKITNVFVKIVAKAKHKSPELCLGTGLIMGGTAIVLVGVNTWKNKDKLAENAKHISELRHYDAEKAAEENPETPIISEEQRIADLRNAYKVMIVDSAKAFWLPTVLVFGSATFIIGGHHILRKELSAMTTAYAILFEDFKRYRENLISDIGIEKDQEYMHGIKMIEEVDEETGKIQTKAVVNREMGCSRYARFFDEGEFDSTISKWIWRNPHWCSNKMDCIRALHMIQSSLNDIFNLRGWLKLNEAYTALGLPCTKEGEHVGWVKDSGHDNFIDFGVFPDFENGRHQLPINKLFLDPRNPQPAALCDFNVDGCIDYIFDDIYEYDNRSYISYLKRNGNQ